MRNIRQVVLYKWATLALFMSILLMILMVTCPKFKSQTISALLDIHFIVIMIQCTFSTTYLLLLDFNEFRGKVELTYSFAKCFERKISEKKGSLSKK